LDLLSSENRGADIEFFVCWLPDQDFFAGFGDKAYKTWKSQ
jgi:hypothetical protein